MGLLGHERLNLGHHRRLLWLREGEAGWLGFPKILKPIVSVLDRAFLLVDESVHETSTAHAKPNFTLLAPTTIDLTKPYVLLCALSGTAGGGDLHHLTI